MRRLLALVVVLVVAVGCSTSKPGEKTASPLPSTVQGTVPKQQTATVPAQYKNGDPAAGKKIFLGVGGCKSCHTLADAGSTGAVGPNLDQAKPDYRLATARVTLGKSPMPSFKGQLTDQQIADVAAYVSSVAGQS